MFDSDWAAKMVFLDRDRQSSEVPEDTRGWGTDHASGTFGFVATVCAGIQPGRVEAIGIIVPCAHQEDSHRNQ